jgi:hypothetical protein
MNAGPDWRKACDSELNRRYESLTRATARRVRLETLFADPDFLGRTLTNGRYLRFCAVIAWASEREELARAEYDMRALITYQQETSAPQVDAA